MDDDTSSVGNHQLLLFPMANDVIPADRHVSVWEDFERVETAETGEFIHEQYLALVKALEQEIVEIALAEWLSSPQGHIETAIVGLGTSDVVVE